MTRITSIALSFILFLLCTGADAQQATIALKLQEITFGQATSTVVTKEAMENSPSGDHRLVENQVFTKKTNRIEAKKGVEFGVEYKLVSKQTDTVGLEIEWIFPNPIIDPQKHTTYKSLRYPIGLPLNFINASTYSLDNDFEVVKGTWQLNIYYSDKIIYTRKFELY
jgi:hypothetical protein